MIKKILYLTFLIQLFVSCGFTPTYKVSNNQDSSSIYYEIDTSSSYIARQILNSLIENLDKDEAKFLITVQIIENESAVNVDSSGSVNEYKIEVLINFEIINMNNDTILYKSQSRGFSNFDVSNSEYANTLSRNEALEKALMEVVQLMNIKIQNRINEL